VVVAIAVTLFLGGGPMAVSQAASSAVLVATLVPPTHGVYYVRFIDALVGGGIGVLVKALLLPRNPLTLVKRAAEPALRALGDALRDCAAALSRRDLDGARAGLDRLRRGEAALTNFKDSLVTAQEAATVAPARWRARAPLAQYRAGLGFSGTVVVAQVRSIAADQLRGSGVDDRIAERSVRRAAGRLPQPIAHPGDAGAR
jgi:uncharacterized membrane protein YgaE (UPF0421/DUF939 family)